MKKLFITLIGITTALVIFAGGAFAAMTWLNYTGGQHIETADSNVDRIMEILREVNTGKITAEQAVSQLSERVDELEDMNPSGLAKQNQELRDEVKLLEGQLGSSNDYIQHLEEQLAIANAEAEQHRISTDNALEEAETYSTQ